MLIYTSKITVTLNCNPLARTPRTPKTLLVSCNDVQGSARM